MSDIFTSQEVELLSSTNWEIQKRISTSFLLIFLCSILTAIYWQVVDAADVILEVLDARDPLGSRCQEMEDLILSSSTDKRLVLVLNKIGETQMKV